MRVRLRSGVPVDQAIQQIETLGINAYGQAMPVGSSHPSDVRDEYVRWATSCERQLMGVMHRDDALAIFDNPRHRDICSMVPGSQTTMLVSNEVQAKSAELGEIAAEIKETRASLLKAPGLPAVIDSNLLLESLRPDQIPWTSLIGQPSRLMIPLRVIEEIDRKKYDEKTRLRKVAREVLAWLEDLFTGSNNGPVRLGGPDDTTIELLLADRPRYRPSDADEEILDKYHEVKLLTGAAKLITADKGMRMRSRAESVDVIVIPDKYHRITGAQTHE
jgi:hypothetical protein